MRTRTRRNDDLTIVSPEHTLYGDTIISLITFIHLLMMRGGGVEWVSNENTFYTFIQVCMNILKE